MTERTLDWKPSRDPRSAAYRFSAVPMCASLTVRPSVMRTKSLWLNQGQEGACTGFGEEHTRALSPYAQRTTDATARDVYYLAQRNDEWEGEDYEGSSVNGAMKAARLMGFIKSWKWATTIEEAKHGLSYHGAGEMGSEWREGMFEPDADGWLNLTGEVAGGHAYAIAGFGWHRGERGFWMENSWGRDWGYEGGAWIREFDFALLLAGGELAFPQKVRF